MYYLFSIIIGYLLGSFPTAYLLLKNKGIDITKTGTGNVGAMNAFEVTNSKTSGLLVFLVDALKGLLAVYIPLLIFPVDFAYPGLALVSAVSAHCFNPWLIFKGGRGLATALGGTVLISPVIPAVWILTWIIIYLIKRDIIAGNIFANFSTILAVCLLWELTYEFSFPKPDSVSTLLFFTFTLMILIFIKHIEPFLELINKKKIT